MSAVIKDKYQHAPTCPKHFKNEQYSLYTKLFSPFQPYTRKVSQIILLSYIIDHSKPKGNLFPCYIYQFTEEEQKANHTHTEFIMYLVLKFGIMQVFLSK